ncbi:MAG: TerB family tellurite resistance protein [Hyphomicrobiaceae bacterium]
MISLVTIFCVLGLAFIIIWRATRRRRADFDPIAHISDPREAASVAMIAVAQANGPMSTASRSAVVGQMQDHFCITADQANALMINAQMMVGEGVDAAEIMRRLLPVLQHNFSHAERQRFIEMLTAVANADGQHDELATFDIYRLSRELGVA